MYQNFRPKFYESVRSRLIIFSEKVVIGGSVFIVGFCVLISISLVILAANFLTRGDIYKVIRFRPRKKPIRQISYKETKTDKPHHHKVAIQNPYE